MLKNLEGQGVLDFSLKSLTNVEVNYFSNEGIGLAF